MALLNWQQQNNQYISTVGDYRATVVEHPRTHFYTAQIESINGKFSETCFEKFADLSSAESWILTVVVDEEQTGDEDLAQQRMLETFDICQSYLPDSIHPSHLQRLAYIREWVISRQDQEDEFKFGSNLENKYAEHVFNWIEREPHHFAADTSHGVVIIQEQLTRRSFSYGVSSTYTTWIEHPTGAHYKWLESFLDFEEAEHWLREALNRLDDPRITEWYLDCIQFTLNICKHVLLDVSVSDPLHRARVEYLETLLAEVLL